MVVVNFPHNPTGFIPTLAEFNEIVELCRQRGAYLFCDEMYRLLEFDTAHRLPAAVDAYEKVGLAVRSGANMMCVLLLLVTVNRDVCYFAAVSVDNHELNI